MIDFRRILLTTTLLCFAAGCGSSPPPEPVPGHPHLLITEKDLERLRSWATSSNSFYSNGVAHSAKDFKDLMDGGKMAIGGDDCIGVDGFMTCEWLMETFAFMSQVSPDADERNDYALHAKQLLMAMIDISLQGPAEGTSGLRDPEFSTSNRSRNAGRAFGLTVDWIYAYLNADEKAAIRTVFLRWADENVHAEITSHNHPEPIGVTNDPALLSDPSAVRFSCNNFFTAHARNLGLMAMALDPEDDPDGQLHAYLDSSTGAFLYMTDAALRGDAAGGLMPEGYEYGPLTSSYLMDLMFALHTAGEDDPEARGPQVVTVGHPYWDAAADAFVHSLAPSLHDLDYPGPYHDYASFGDMETYEPYSGVIGDPILTLGPIAIMAREKGDEAMYDKVRWIELNMPPGGADPDQIATRSNSIYSPLNAIGYFMLMDPSSPPPADPRPSMPLEYYAPGLRYLFARTGWGQDDSYFTYQLSWAGIDHQHGDGNTFGLHRKGEWITKEHTAYGGFESSLHNTISIENDQPDHDDSLSTRIWKSGSQQTYSADGSGEVVATSVTPEYAYALGDSTAMYNSTLAGQTDVVHASRSIVWLEPDHVVIYDRAESKTAGRFKRFTLQAPSPAAIDGNVAAATTASGQKMFLTKLLPAGASIVSDIPILEYDSQGEPMVVRLTVESKDQSARFLHVVQGGDPGSTADPATLAESTSGTAYAAAVVKGTLVAFPVDIGGTFTSMEIDAPDTTTRFLVTGLVPGAGYDWEIGAPSGGKVHVTVTSGGATMTDSGGVLAFGF